MSEISTVDGFAADTDRFPDATAPTQSEAL
jgi:hypothetical protein